MSGGLDALETLGKKTMEALSDGDPGMFVLLSTQEQLLFQPEISL